ncbi:MAG: hypothetical protein V1734_05790 [Nanoarchaeota archaeon]
MKGKTLIALIIAVLMVASIVSAGAFASLGNILYDKMAARTFTQSNTNPNSNNQLTLQNQEIQTITNTGAGQNSPGTACASQNDCPNGNCVCKCAQRQANAGSGSNTGTSACNACLARCTASCASSGQTPPPQTGDSSGTATLPCTSNNQCSAGVCFIAKVNEGVCWSLREIGGLCDENADCRSNNCANMVTTGSARRGICALTVASGSGTLSTGIKINLPFTTRAISISGFKTPTGIITPPPAGTPVLPNNGAVCTTPSQCASKICSLQAATATRAAQRLCSATCRASADCETEKTCSAGRCGTPDAPQLRANGITCANNAQCSSGYCNMLRKVCADSPTDQQTPPLTCEQRCVETCSPECRGQGQEVSACMQECNEKQSGCVSTKNECQTRCRQRDEPIDALQGCIDGCDTSFAACVEDVRLCRSVCPAGREAPGTKKVGETCSSSAGCETECETGYGECGCEAGIKQEGDSCSENNECEAGLECAGNWLFGKKCTKVEAEEEAVIEALPLEVQAQIRTQFDAMEPKLEAMEQQVVQDRLVASKAELIAMNPGCFGEITDVEQKAECLEERLKTLINLLETKNIITPDQAKELNEKAGINADAEEEIIVEVSPPPLVQRSFTDRVKNMFGFGLTAHMIKVTGKVVFPGYDLGIDLPPDTGSTTENPSDYWSALETQYTGLRALETTICSKLPIPGLNPYLLKSCPCLTRDGPNPYTCESNRCKINKEDVCPEGEFGAVAPEDEETPPPAAPATCDSLISFDIVSACRGHITGYALAFVNITIRNTGSIGIDAFGVNLFESGTSWSGVSTTTGLAAGEQSTKKVTYTSTKYDAYKKAKAIPKMSTLLCNDKAKFIGDYVTQLPICRGMPCSTGDACESGTTCLSGVCALRQVS